MTRMQELDQLIAAGRGDHPPAPDRPANPFAAARARNAKRKRYDADRAARGARFRERDRQHDAENRRASRA